jgi:membrane-associated phospholipid phosphatase
VRRRSDALLLAGAVLLLVLSALPVHEDQVPQLERDVFQAVNDSVTVPFVLVWPVMQLGNFLVVPLAAAAAAVARRFRLGLGLLAGGVVAWLLAKVIKQVATRGRPGALLPDVHLRGASPGGLGYVSGHAAVAVLIATVAWVCLGRRIRWVAATLAALVCLARVYVGAHLPLDVVGGAALGLAVGAAVRLVLGRPSPTAEPASGTGQTARRSSASHRRAPGSAR